MLKRGARPSENFIKKQTFKVTFTYIDYWLSDFLIRISHSSAKIMKMTSAHIRSLSKSIFNLEFSLVVLFLVLLSGDVSENPGPENSETSSQSKKISNDQELIQSDPISCPQNQKGNN